MIEKDDNLRGVKKCTEILKTSPQILSMRNPEYTQTQILILVS